MRLCLCLSFRFSAFLCDCLFVSLSLFFLSFCDSVILSCYLSACLSHYLSVCFSVSSPSLSFFLFLYHSNFFSFASQLLKFTYSLQLSLSSTLSLRLSLFLSVSNFVYLSLCLINIPITYKASVSRDAMHDVVQRRTFVQLRKSVSVLRRNRGTSRQRLRPLLQTVETNRTILKS